MPSTLGIVWQDSGLQGEQFSEILYFQNNSTAMAKLIHHCTRLGFLEHQGQDERLVAPVASGAGVGLASEHQQLCLKPCCHDLNTRFSLNKFYHQNTKHLNRLFGCVGSSCWGRSLLADAPCPSCLPGYTRQSHFGSLKSLICHDRLMG